MKKTLAVLFAGAVSAAALAGINNVVISFSTPGPDTYADGTTVLDGECYALVWTPTGATFAGFAADGAALGGSKVVLAAPVAKGGKCPRVMFQIDETYRAANYPNGTFDVYLLDTRKFATDEAGETTATVQGVTAAGKIALVNGYGAVAKASGAGTLATATPAAGGVAVTAASAVPTDAPKPTVKAIKIVGGYVYVTVENALPCIQYTLDSGAAPDKIAADAEASSGYGDDAGEVILVTPQKPGANFFKVNRK